MRLRFVTRLLFSLTGLFAAAAVLYAQTNSGEVTGRVADKSDSIVMNAHVLVRNLDTEVSDGGAVEVLVYPGWNEPTEGSGRRSGQALK